MIASRIPFWLVRHRYALADDTVKMPDENFWTPGVARDFALGLIDQMKREDRKSVV